MAHHREIHDERRPYYMFPRGYRTGCEWLYAIGLPGDQIKVGLSGKPRDRMMQHWRQFKGRVLWAHVFAPIAVSFERRAYHTERRAIELLQQHGCVVPGTKERFTGVAKRQAIQLVRQAYAEVA